MRFGVLGPLQVIAGDADEPGTISGVRLRVLLAVLLSRANRPVPTDELAELVWDGTPPGGAPEAIRALVMRLRRQLDKRAAARIVTSSPGYAVEVSADELDASRFEMLTRQAGAQARADQWADAALIASEALALWRGRPLSDIPAQLLRDQWVPHLEQLRAQALDWRIEADLHQGRHQELIAELVDLISRHPLRENLHGQLMLALYRCGRQAEALAAYQHARRTLVAELGIEPGPELRDLHQRILSGNLDRGEPSPGTFLAGQPGQGEPNRQTPRELPATVPGFTGRSAELQELTRLLDRPGAQAPGTVVISAIGGTAGVGKTALAVHWAHQAAGRFPDGQLYVNLRGYDPGQRVTAADALAGFLRSLGVPGQDIPPEEDERAARYRSLLAGRQLLVILDNAGSAEQVRPLLPGTPACTVVVTSRDTLSGLMARDGAARLDLDVLSLADAVALLRTLIGPRVDAEPEVAAKLAVECCRLPLALRVAAQLTVGRPTMPLSGLADELADLRRRLDLLETDADPRTQVRTVFSWSYRYLDDADARTFRLLGLHPGPDLEPYAVAALTGTTVPQARQALDTLAGAHLIQPVGPDRYGMHDLLRGYACELAVADEDEPQQALIRLFDHYLHTAAVSMDTLFPAERHRRPRVPRPATTPVPGLTDPETARRWLDAERAGLVLAVGYAATHGWLSHATRLAATLARYLRNDGHFPEAVTIFSHALGAARRAGDRAAEAAALNQIGLVDLELGRVRQSGDHLREALTLFRAAGDQIGEAYALGNIGISETQLGHYEQAARHQQEAADLYRDIGDRLGQARALGNLGLVRHWQGRYQEAADYQQQALVVSREFGDRLGEAYALARLGGVDRQLGRYQHAADYVEQALLLFREIGGTPDVADTLARLGEIYFALGRYARAAGNFEQSLAISRELDDLGGQAQALNGLGDVLFQEGETERARTHYAAGLRLASQTGAPRQQARAHNGLAHAYHADGDTAQARQHWSEALAIYTELDVPEAGEVRAFLERSAPGLTHASGG